MGRGTEHCHERCRRKTQVCLNKSRNYCDIGDSFPSIFFIFFVETLVNIGQIFILFWRKIRKISNILLTFRVIIFHVHGFFFVILWQFPANSERHPVH